MNGRITLSKTPAGRVSAMAISVLWKKFKEFKEKPSTSRSVLDTAYLEQFLDYADLEPYIQLSLEKEFLLVRIDESGKNQDRYRKMKLNDELRDVTKRINDLKL